MMLPGAVLILLFSYLPMFGIIIPFKDINMRDGILGSPWCGLQNFEFLFRTEDAWLITRNTIGYNVIFIIIGTFLNVSIAIMMSLFSSKRASKIYQTIIIMPYFLSYVIVSYLVFAFLSMDNGFLNKTILPMLGIEPINWYTVPEQWPWILCVVNFWKWTGYSSVVYLAAIAGIDVQLYEAAEIDGANKWKQIIHITLPSLKLLIVIQTILSIGKILNSDFGLFYQVPMNSGALYSTTSTINTYVYNKMISGGAKTLGMSSAAAFYQSVVGFVLVLLANMIVNKVDPDSALF
ncbi:sugar ABC transporter permease [Oscillospiraceae bacterium DSM 107454]|uniref:Sugar ABC transporter permease n=2 Tax=Ructibacterium gallinarum TaxID=2779355 RepID=A0A9D5RCC9_9FIRM|nr:sugar ABC transporter permease [Ructibacterium gallinarum]